MAWDPRHSWLEEEGMRHLCIHLADDPYEDRVDPPTAHRLPRRKVARMALRRVLTALFSGVEP
jgi:hypothetical protein